jgi:uncharacterized protein (TIGR02271 family)
LSADSAHLWDAVLFLPLSYGDLRIVGSSSEDENCAQGEPYPTPAIFGRTEEAAPQKLRVLKSRELESMTSKLEKLEQDGEVVVPLHAEEWTVTKQRVLTGRTRIWTETQTQEQDLQEPLIREWVEIERRAVGQPIEEMPAIRQEGETIVIPVVEEQVVLERRLILKEEVRVTRIRKTEIHRERVVTRKQNVRIARLPYKEGYET